MLAGSDKNLTYQSFFDPFLILMFDQQTTSE